MSGKNLVQCVQYVQIFGIRDVAEGFTAVQFVRTPCIQKSNRYAPRASVDQNRSRENARFLTQFCFRLEKAVGQSQRWSSRFSGNVALTIISLCSLER
jgi:hypothetical protein